MSSPIDTTKTGAAVDRLDPYIYTPARREPWIVRVLWNAAGVDEQLIEKCPHSDRVKWQGIGGVVLATAALAFVSSSYALYTVFCPKLGDALSPDQQQIHWPTAGASVAVGLVWSLILYNLDRFVVSSTGHGDGTEKVTWSEFWGALPRLLMAVFIGITLSAPLEIRIMKKEIDAELTKQQTKYRDELNATVEPDYNARKTELKARAQATQTRLDERVAYFESRRQEIQKQRQALQDEADGKIGGRAAGEGPAFHTKDANLRVMLVDLEQDKAKFAAKEEKDLEASISADKQAIKDLDESFVERKRSNEAQSRSYDGLVRRIKIGHDISLPVSVMLTFLLMTVEVAPIFFKMMLIKGSYDHLEENQRRLAVARRSIALSSASVRPGEGAEGRELREDAYHEPDTILAHEQGRLEVEAVLTRAAQEAFAEKTKARIRARPEDYIQTRDSSETA